MTREEAINQLEDCFEANIWYKPDYGITFRHKWVQAYEMAISALREQEERSKGCGYCRPPFRTLLTVTIDPETGEEPTTIFFECDGQALRTYDDNPNNPQIDRANIKFCPMCGRRLEEV